MADNTAMNATDTIATDELATLNGGASSGVKVQRVKPVFGVDGDARDVSIGYPLPVNVMGSGSSVTPTTITLNAIGASTLAGSASTTGSAVIDVSNAGNASFHLLTTAFVGTVVFEQSFDPAGANGTWAPVPCMPEDTLSAPMSALTISTAVSYVRQFTQGMFGPSLFRIRVSAFTSGTLSVYLKAGPGWVEAQPALAPSSATIGAVSLTGGTSVAPVAGITANQTPPGAGGTGTVTLTLTAVTAAAVLIAAPGAGLSIYVTDMEGSNSGATGTLHSLFEGTTALRYARFVAPSGGGYVTNLRTPWKLPANTAVGYASSAASTSNYLTVSYFIAP